MFCEHTGQNSQVLPELEGINPETVLPKRLPPSHPREPRGRRVDNRIPSPASSELQPRPSKPSEATKPEPGWLYKKQVWGAPSWTVTQQCREERQGTHCTQAGVGADPASARGVPCHCWGISGMRGSSC